IKPTVGLVSRAGIVPISHTQDTAGPMARTVADAVALLDAIVGPDPRDAATQSAKRSERSYARYLDPNGLKGARIGVARQLFGYNEHVDKLMRSSLETLKKLGAELIDPVNFTDYGKLGEPELDVLLYELKAGLKIYLEGRGSRIPVRSLKDVIEFNEKNAEREMPYYAQDLFVKAESKGPLTDEAYLKALATCRRLSREGGIDAVMDAHKLDAIVAPTGAPAWKTDWANGDATSGGSSTYPAVAGYPHITVPAGWIFGLPAGLSFFGRAWSEGPLIQYAYAFEQATKARRAPSFAVPSGH
ncbi:MAG: amidase family protein, partial [Bryobacteraceae bacterium]